MGWLTLPRVQAGGQLVEKRQVEAGGTQQKKKKRKKEGISTENTQKCPGQHLSGSHFPVEQLYLLDTQKKFQKSWLSTQRIKSYLASV